MREQPPRWSASPPPSRSPAHATYAEGKPSNLVDLVAAHRDTHAQSRTQPAQATQALAAVCLFALAAPGDRRRRGGLLCAALPPLERRLPQPLTLGRLVEIHRRRLVRRRRYPPRAFRPLVLEGRLQPRRCTACMAVTGVDGLPNSRSLRRRGAGIDALRLRADAADDVGAARTPHPASHGDVR